MAGFQIIVKDQAIIARLRKLQAATGDLSPVLEPAGERMKLSVEQNFEAGGRPKWQPLSAVTIKLKGNSRILIDRGFLKNVTLKITKGQAIIGTQPNTAAYAARQQLGWPGGGARYGGKVKTPARPFLVLQDADREYILELVDRHIKKAMTS
jgi:phage virion morphogenesis protein